MTRMPTFRALLAASVCLLPLQAMAQSTSGFDIDDAPAAKTAGPVPSNWFEIGGQFNTSRSYYLGRYNGTVDPGLSALGSFHYGQRDAWNSGGTNYFEMDGRDLGSWDRSFSAKVGQQGTWGAWFAYDGIPYYGTNSFQSIYQSTGALAPGVTAASLSLSYVNLIPKAGIFTSLWIPVATNSPAASMLHYNLDTRRDIYSGGGKYQYGDWSVSAGWKHEHKEGAMSNSLAIGGAPGVTSTSASAAAPTSFTSGLAYFAQPISYDMDRYDVTAAYSTPKLQAQVGYTFSNFTDNLQSFNAANPFNFFSPTLGTTFGGPTSNLTSQYTLPPSNSAHQLKGQFGYNFTPTTRLNVNLGYGLNMQNAPYVQGIGNSNIAAPVLPRNNFDGVMENYFANIALTAQPTKEIGLRVFYTLDDRENRSSQNAYLGYPINSATTSFTYTNLPFSYRSESIGGEVSYRLGPQTKVTLADTLSYTARTFTDTTQVTTNRVSAKIRGPLMDNLFGNLSVMHEDRDAHAYNAQGWWKATCNGCSVEPSNLVMFSEASRKHDEVKTTLDYSPVNNITLSFSGKASKDTYPSGKVGLRNNNNLNIGPDVSWQVSKLLSLHAYYNYQQLFFTQGSIYQSPGAPSVPAPTPANTQYSVPWQMRSTDSVHTLGVNADWQAIEDVLKFTFDYNMSYGDTAYALGEGVVAYGGAITSTTFLPSITVQQLPDVKSMLNIISLHGEYTFRPNMTMLFGYAFERFTSKDFMNGQSSTTFANALLPGTVNPNASVHIVSAALRVRF